MPNPVIGFTMVQMPTTPSQPAVNSPSSFGAPKHTPVPVRPFGSQVQIPTTPPLPAFSTASSFGASKHTPVPMRASSFQVQNQIATPPWNSHQNNAAIHTPRATDVNMADDTPEPVLNDVEMRDYDSGYGSGKDRKRPPNRVVKKTDTPRTKQLVKEINKQKRTIKRSGLADYQVLSEQLQSKIQEYSTSISQVREYEAHLQELNSQAQAKEAESKEETSKISKTLKDEQNEFADLAKALADHETTIENLRGENEGLKQSKRESQLKEQQLNEKCIGLQEKAIAREADAECWKKHYDEQIPKCQALLQAKVLHTDALENEVGWYKHEYGNLRVRTCKLEGENGDLLQQISSLNRALVITDKQAARKLARKDNEISRVQEKLESTMASLKKFSTEACASMKEKKGLKIAAVGDAIEHVSSKLNGSNILTKLVKKATRSMKSQDPYDEEEQDCEAPVAVEEPEQDDAQEPGQDEAQSQALLSEAELEARRNKHQEFANLFFSRKAVALANEEPGQVDTHSQTVSGAELEARRKKNQELANSFFSRTAAISADEEREESGNEDEEDESEEDEGEEDELEEEEGEEDGGEESEDVHEDNDDASGDFPSACTDDALDQFAKLKLDSKDDYSTGEDTCDRDPATQIQSAQSASGEIESSGQDVSSGPSKTDKPTTSNSEAQPAISQAQEQATDTSSSVPPTAQHFTSRQARREADKKEKKAASKAKKAAVAADVATAAKAKKIAEAAKVAAANRPPFQN